MPRLKHISCGDIIFITGSPFSIGRSLTSDYVIANRAVSRNHCTFESQSEGWTLTDNSTNGTCVNSIVYKGIKSSVLKNEDVILLGDGFKYKFLTSIKTRVSENSVPKATDSSLPLSNSVGTDRPPTKSLEDVLNFDTELSDEVLCSAIDDVLKKVENIVGQTENGSNSNKQSPNSTTSVIGQTDLINNVQAEVIHQNPSTVDTESNSNIVQNDSVIVNEASNVSNRNSHVDINTITKAISSPDNANKRVKVTVLPACPNVVAPSDSSSNQNPDIRTAPGTPKVLSQLTVAQASPTILQLPSTSNNNLRNYVRIQLTSEQVQRLQSRGQILAFPSNIVNVMNNPTSGQALPGIVNSSATVSSTSIANTVPSTSTLTTNASPVVSIDPPSEIGNEVTVPFDGGPTEAVTGKCDIRNTDKSKSCIDEKRSSKLHTSQEAEPSKKSSQDVESQKATDVNTFEEFEDELQCSICSELFVKSVTLNCSHSFCEYCINMWKKTKSICPICRTTISNITRTRVLDNFIEKIVENSKGDIKEQRKQLLEDREKLSRPPVPPPAPNRNTSRRGGRNNRNRNRNRSESSNSNYNTRTSNRNNNRNNRQNRNNAQTAAAAPAAQTSTNNVDLNIPAPPPAEVLTISSDSSSSSSSSSSTTASTVDDNWEADYYADDYVDYEAIMMFHPDYYGNGRQGAYFGGYGQCFRCGDPGHWANGCPNR